MQGATVPQARSGAARIPCCADSQSRTPGGVRLPQADGKSIVFAFVKSSAVARRVGELRSSETRSVPGSS